MLRGAEDLYITAGVEALSVAQPWHIGILAAKAFLTGTMMPCS